MSNPAINAGSFAQSGIHAVDRPVSVELLRSGSTFLLACSECHQMIARDLPDAIDLRSQAELIASHRAECVGPREWWVRRMIRLFALS